MKPKYQVGDEVLCKEEELDEGDRRIEEYCMEYIGTVRHIDFMDIGGEWHIEGDPEYNYVIDVHPNTGHTQERHLHHCECPGFVLPKPTGWFIPERWIVGLANVPYDPTQQGDTEDDI